MSGHSAGHKLFVFEDFSLDVDSRTLRENGSEIRLAQRPFDILVDLIENNERVVSRNELLDKFWNGQYVYDDALRKSVAAIRKALRDGRPASFIETRYGGGFRFIADVKMVEKNGNGTSDVHVAVTSLYEGHSVDPNRRPRTRRFALALALFVIVGLTGGFYAFSTRTHDPSPESPAATASQIRSIMVMPIKNVSGETANDYFSEGVTESIITQMSRSKGLRIISSRSLFAQTNKDSDFAGLGRELNADALLEGSLQRRGENVNVRVRLVRVSDGSVIWTSNDFERSMSSAFDLQDAIACDISAELRSEICIDGGNSTKVGLAYQEYLKGRYEWNKRTAAAIARSIEHYELAIQFDPKYSLAYAGLADSYVQSVWYMPSQASSAVTHAIDAATKAIELDPGSAEAHTSLASAYQLAWRWDDAGLELQRAIELNPNYARAHHVNAYHLSTRGYYDEALASIRRAHDIDPLNLVIRADTAMILIHGWQADPSRIEAALHQCRELVAAYPDYAETYTYLALIGWMKGDGGMFIDNFIESKRRNGATEAVLATYKKAHRNGGGKAVLRIELAALKSQVNSRSASPSIWVSALYSATGEHEQAIKWLRRSFDGRSADFIGVGGNPYFDPIRFDARFQELLQKAGL